MRRWRTEKGEELVERKCRRLDFIITVKEGHTFDTLSDFELVDDGKIKRFESEHMGDLGSFYVIEGDRLLRYAVDLDQFCLIAIEIVVEGLQPVDDGKP